MNIKATDKVAPVYGISKRVSVEIKYEYGDEHDLIQLSMEDLTDDATVSLTLTSEGARDLAMRLTELSYEAEGVEIEKVMVVALEKGVTDAANELRDELRGIKKEEPS